MARTGASAGDETDGGFSLIELLVVMVIVGVLAAIAIPVFLGQRRTGYDTAAKSDLRNLAFLEEERLHQRDFYGSLSELRDDNEDVAVTKNVTLTVVHYDVGVGFCLTAKHASSATTWFYDSRGQGLQPSGTAACPFTTTGSGGGSVSG